MDLPLTHVSVADPGFPVGGGGGRGPRSGGVGVDSRGGYISKFLYVKTKESGPLGGVVRQATVNVDPPLCLVQVGTPLTFGINLLQNLKISCFTINLDYIKSVSLHRLLLKHSNEKQTFPLPRFVF